MTSEKKKMRAGTLFRTLSSPNSLLTPCGRPMDGWFPGGDYAAGGPPPHPRLTRISRWSTPHPWDSFVAAACSYFCFVGPLVLLVVGLTPFLLFLPLIFVWWVTLEAAWLIHRWHLRTTHEPWTSPDAYPERREHLERFLRLEEDCIPCFEDYLSKWFRGAPRSLIRTENVREFLRYGFYGSVDDGPLSTAEEEEIEWFIRSAERTWGIRFEPGRTEGLRFMAHMVRLFCLRFRSACVCMRPASRRWMGWDPRNNQPPVN